MSVVYFTDRDLGNAFPDRLALAGLRVERHNAHFAPGCPDEDWLRVVGERGWIAVTRDTRIRYKPNELDAVIRHHVALLVLVGKAPHAELAENFVRSEAEIRRFVEERSPPWIAKVYRPRPADLVRRPSASGSVALWYPKARV